MANPHKSAQETPIFWLPNVDPGVLALSALPQPLRSSSPVPPSDFIWQLTDADGRHALRNQSPSQVWLVDDPPSAAQLGALIPFDEMLPQRLAAALSLWHQMQGRQTDRSPEITPQRRSRLILGLRALDGSTENCSHREIARSLFGAHRVPSGPAWKSYHLRSRTIRLIAGARALRDGGYRDLLRSGRTVRF